MDSQRLAPDHSSTNVRDTFAQTALPSLKRSLLTGAIGFSLTSLLVFGSVTFQRLLYDHLTVVGTYLVWIAVFILLGATALSRIVVLPKIQPWFYAIFSAAFFVYGISWMAAYFAFRIGLGEWLGSLAGSVGMGIVFAVGFKVPRLAPLFSVLLLVANSIGYFVGSMIYWPLGKPVGISLWGAFYGACLGAGFGAVIYLAQSKALASSSSKSGHSDVR
jgi:hypothetical protein